MLLHQCFVSNVKFFTVTKSTTMEANLCIEL